MTRKNKLPRVSVLIPAAGSGRRMGSKRAKQFLEIHGFPILVLTLRQFERCPDITDIVIVGSASELDFIRRLIEANHINKVFKIVEGGAERTDSVARGLKDMHPETEIVLIHDAVRPFVSVSKIQETIQSVSVHGAALLMVPEKATVKQVQDGWVTTTLDRDLIWQAQTPQGFRFDLIKKAYEIAMKEGIKATDDTALVERLGHPVHVVEGEEENIKITTPVDLVMAERIFNTLKNKSQ